MKLDEMIIQTTRDEDLSPDALAEFLYLLKATYGAALKFSREKQIEHISGLPSEVTIAEFRRYMLHQSAISVDSLFSTASMDYPLLAKKIVRGSPWEFIIYGAIPALLLAMIISGGEIKFMTFGCKLNALGDGIKKLRAGLGLGKNMTASFGVRSARIKLSKTEYAELKKQDPSKKNTGGFQSYLVSIQNRINKSTLELELSSSDLERIERYKSNPKKGGFQSRFLKIFGRHFPD